MLNELVTDMQKFLCLNNKSKEDFTEQELGKYIYRLRTQYEEFFRYSNFTNINRYEWLLGCYSILKTMKSIRD